MNDPGETTDVAARHPDVVKRLLALAERTRDDIGKHDRVGKNMRFYDPMKKPPHHIAHPFRSPRNSEAMVFPE